jgi:predicted GTPase
MTGRRRVLILGAAGRDFHNFNVAFRRRSDVEVVAFTATQIPRIEGRRYPPELAGPHHPDGIPIHPETDLEELIEQHGVHDAVFAYSDISYGHLGNVASRVLAAGANVVVLGPRDTMIDAPVPVVAVTAVRTGCGKSPTTRHLVQALRDSGRRVVVVRHPMPYGDLAAQAVQRFETRGDLDDAHCTFEEREEYESHIDAGAVVYAGVDYDAILQRAAEEADVVFWDGGNNDWPFYRPDVWVALADPLRPGHELTHFPGEVNIRAADIVVIAKVNSAAPDEIATVTDNVTRLNPDATLVPMRSVVTVDGDPDTVRGKRVLCVEDGPTLTHGGMSFGAGHVAANNLGAAEIVDPRPHAVDSIRDTLDRYPHIGKLLPAMGYYPQQIADLEASIRATRCDLVLVGTPFDLARQLDVDKPMLRVRYEVEDDDPGRASLAHAVLDRLPAPAPASA